MTDKSKPDEKNLRVEIVGTRASDVTVYKDKAERFRKKQSIEKVGGNRI